MSVLCTSIPLDDTTVPSNYLYIYMYIQGGANEVEPYLAKNKSHHLGIVHVPVILLYTLRCSSTQFHQWLCAE